MPVHLERRNGKYCVVEPSGDVVPSGCYAKKADAVARLRAMNANMEKANFLVKQDKNGLWHWMGIPSNNWMDTHLEILTSKAHRYFVNLVDTGQYSKMLMESWLSEIGLFKEIAQRGTPDLWFWHIPVPIGYADMIAYAEPSTKEGSGFLVATGKQREGEVFDTIFEGLSVSEPGEWGMSHGMPDLFLIRNKENPRYIDGYLSTELTVLPAEEAANFGTAIGVTKEGAMNIPTHKLAIMRQKFGDEAVTQFGALLDELEFFATDSDIPRKEINMNEDTVDAQVEEEVLDAETEEVEEVEETETEEESDEAVAESSDDAGSDEEEVEEQTETGMDMNPTEFKVPTDLKAFAGEIAEGMKEVFAEYEAKQSARFDAIQKQLDEQRAEMTKLKEADEKKIAEKAADTPDASMAGWLSAKILGGSVIGNEDARLKGDKERALYNTTKEAEEEQPVVPGVPPMIGKMITRQRGVSRQWATSQLTEEGQ